MTETQVEVINVGAAAPKLVAGGEGADRCCCHGAGRGRFGGCPRGWDPYQPIISLAPAAV